MTTTAAAPNTFVPGVPKAGTTSLAGYLAQHPEVFLPDTKEPNHYLYRVAGCLDGGPAPRDVVHHLFHRHGVADAAAFRALYEPGADRPVRIDGSVRYLYHPVALDEIRRDVPDARFVVVLRDPVERMASHWRMNRQFHLEPLDLPGALAAEDERVAAGWDWDWHYRRVSTYAPQLERLFATFPREQALVLLYGDLVREPDTTLARCFAFLGIDPDLSVDTSGRGMVPTEARWPTLDRLLVWPTTVQRALRATPRRRRAWRSIVRWNERWNTRPPTPLDAATLVGLADRFAGDRRATADLLGLREAELVERLAGRSPLLVLP